MCRRRLLGSVATAAGQGDFASFPAIRAIVKTVGAKANPYLTLADGAVSFAGAAFFRQVALRAKSRTLHGGLSGKLYLSLGGCGKAKVKAMRKSLNSFDTRTAPPPGGAWGRLWILRVFVRCGAGG